MEGSKSKKKADPRVVRYLTPGNPEVAVTATDEHRERTGLDVEHLRLVVEDDGTVKAVPFEDAVGTEPIANPDEEPRASEDHPSTDDVGRDEEGEVKA